jgi:predicted TIM-barrel fold metal-dependent hydrolase
MLAGISFKFSTENHDKKNEVVIENKLNHLLKAFLNDIDSKQMINQMDLAGIQKSVLLIIDGGIGMGEAEFSIEEIFEFHHRILNAHPDRFIVFAGMDPRRGKKGLDLFSKSISNYNFKGLKLYPPMGYKMDDSRLYDYYELCSEKSLPVLIHTGHSLPMLQNSLADPMNILPVTKRFTNVNFVLAHAGYALKNENVRRIAEAPNVYFDIAGFQNSFKTVDRNMLDTLGIIFQKEFNMKVIFGSDWPLFNIMSPTSAFVELIKKLYEQYDGEKHVNGLENILYNNAARILKLN